MDREQLRSRLLPHGAILADVPPDWRGLKWDEFIEVHWMIMREETVAQRDDSEPEINGKAIATPRDRYGWRSL